MGDPFGLVGTTIAGKYRIESVLGEGGFGVVYAATQAMLNERVAIKIIKPGAPGSTAFAAAAFLREARLLFKLSHPGIVRMYEAGEVPTPFGDAPFVVLELLDGTPLDVEIRRRAAKEAPPFTAFELRGIFEPILEALAFAHGQGVVHRDIKPSNIMVLKRDGALSAKILDFGMAAGAPNTSMTGAGLTPLYASPEQWNATFGSIGPASDVFALGLSFEEAATLEPVVTGDSVPEIVASATNALRQSRIARARPDLPRALEAFAVKATRVWPPDRFASAREMLDALRAAYVVGPSLPPNAGHPSAPSFVSNAPASPYAATVGHYSTTGASLPAAPPAHHGPPPIAQISPVTTRKSGAPIGCIIGGIAGALVLLLLLGGVGVAYYVTQEEAAPTKQVAPPTSGPTPKPTPVVVLVDAGAPVKPQPSPSPTRSNVPPSPTPTPSPSPSPTPSPPPPPAAAQFYARPSGARAGIDPDFPKFSAVVTANGASMKTCFVREGITDEWSAGFDVTFRGGGVKGIRNSFITHAGAPEASALGTRIRECITNEAIQWRWPDPPHPEETPDKAAFVRVLTGMSAKPP